MGLDMYAYAVPVKYAVSPLRVNPRVHGTQAKDYKDNKKVNLYYWRKHHDLHGWMHNLWIKKGGEGEFNCKMVELTSKDLTRLARSVKAGGLPRTTGFFFGRYPPGIKSAKEDLEFIKRARSAIKKGLKVYYDSWW